MKKNKKLPKKIFFLLASFLFINDIFSQEAESGEQENTQKSVQEAVQTEEQSSFQKNTSRNFDFLLQFAPSVYINTKSTRVSAPSPVVYPFSAGISWPLSNGFLIQPSVSFFMMHHLLYEGIALPAEIENRTTTTLCFMMNIPAGYNMRLENSLLNFEAGLGILMRFGFISPGVKKSDSGWTENAGTDVKKINNWFWSNLHWLYLTMGTSWLFDLKQNIKAGPSLNFSFPLGTLISDHNLQGMMISVGIKISL